MLELGRRFNVCLRIGKKAGEYWGQSLEHKVFVIFVSPQNGPLVVDLNPSWGPKSQDTISGCVLIDKGLAHDISKSPENYYLQLADASYPEGAARAQLIR